MARADRPHIFEAVAGPRGGFCVCGLVEEDPVHLRTLKSATDVARGRSKMTLREMSVKLNAAAAELEEIASAEIELMWHPPRLQGAPVLWRGWHVWFEQPEDLRAAGGYLWFIRRSQEMPLAEGDTVKGLVYYNREFTYPVIAAPDLIICGRVQITEDPAGTGLLILTAHPVTATEIPAQRQDTEQ